MKILLLTSDGMSFKEEILSSSKTSKLIKDEKIKLVGKGKEIRL